MAETTQVEKEEEVNADVYFGTLTGIHGRQISFEWKDRDGEWFDEVFPLAKNLKPKDYVRALASDFRFVVVNGEITQILDSA